jgi:hypothetical protein
MPRAAFAGAAVVVAIVAGTVVATVSSRPVQSTAAGTPSSPTTVTVEERDLSAMISEAGTLTFQAQADGSPYSVVNRAAGIYTELPRLGQVIPQGQVLYRVDDSPVVLLYGSTPAYRTLAPGTTGADVAELNADLVALKEASASEIPAASDVFTQATAAALERLQASLGIAEDGVLALGQTVFLPAALRVTAVSGVLGGTAEMGQPVVQGTSTTRVVTIDLDAAQQSLVKVGDPVTIKLPDGRSTPGVISAVGTVATAPKSNQAGGADATPTISVLASPTDPTATGAWDQAPVNATIATARVTRALVVPVDSLLAEAGGAYAVELVGGDGAHRLVPVTLGLFDDADGLVQVSGPQLAAGQHVVVPTP